ncbi:MAG: hypothetical protein FWE43_02995 [Streptococcaceae bacterium]|nr:hypothetical protein [Streptococcaceae bacterium]MCL2681430.1 hypothetical protein [Streptococcaceae bacterium]
MIKDKSTEKRVQLGRQIQEVENKIDELSHEKRKHEDFLDEQASQLKQQHRKLGELNQRLHGLGDKQAERVAYENQAIYEALNRNFNRQVQELDEAYRITQNQMEEERERLNTERGNLPW